MTEIGTLAFAWLATAWLHGLFLFALAWAAERLGLFRAGGLRQAVWRGVLLVPLVTAALQLGALGGSPSYRQELAPAPVAAPQGAPVSGEVVAVQVPVNPPTIVRARGIEVGQVLAVLPGALGLAWLGWAALAAFGVGVQRLRLSAYRRRLAPLGDPAAVAAAEDLGRRAGLKRLRLYEDPALSGPVALASGDIVLPAWTRDALTDAQHAALLAHEVRHLARRDPEWRALLGLAGLAALVPHARFVLSRLDALAEEACDAWSARATGEGRALAQCLAACLERGLRDRAPGWSSAMAAGPVVERVRRLLEGRADFDNAPRGLAAALLAGVGAAALLLPGFAVGQPVIAPAARPTPARIAPAPRPAEPAEPILAYDWDNPSPLAPLEPVAALAPIPAAEPAAAAEPSTALAPLAEPAAIADVPEAPEPPDLPDAADRVRPRIAPAARVPPALGALSVTQPIPPVPAVAPVPVVPVVPVVPPAPTRTRPMVAPTPPVPPIPPAGPAPVARTWR